MKLIIMYVVAFVILIIGIICLFRAVRLLSRIEKMIEAAMDGDFAEQNYNESNLSKVEHKFARFLRMSSLSKRKLECEKKQIQQTISDMSHQTKTPITNMLLYTQLLEEMLIDEDERNLLNQISQQANKLHFLVQSLIKISRLETEVFQLVPKKQSLNVLLSGIASEYQEKAENKQITLEWIKTDASASYDDKWTKEAVGNIVDNAIKYTPEGGRIQMEVKEYDMFVSLSIKDNGIGIAREEQASIFKRFYRSEQVNQCEGVGIGLYLAREIISREGGYIKVCSEPGEGSVFSVFLPVA